MTKEDLLKYRNPQIPIPQDIANEVARILEFDEGNEFIIKIANEVAAQTDVDLVVQTAILQRCALSLSNP